MRKKIGLIFLVGSLVFFLSMNLIFAQEQTASEQVATEKSTPEPKGQWRVGDEVIADVQKNETQYAGPETPAESETQWLWGEVISVDIQKNELLVKCLDYETDQEKEVAIAVDDKTTYENIKALLEIKPQDTVSVDYIVNPEGKNIAKNISVEKPQVESAPQEGTVGEVKPQDIQPSETAGD